MTSSESSSCRPSISFVVLALNEEANIETTVKNVHEAVASGMVSDYEIILVNDGSTDATGRIMDDLARGNPKMKVLHNEKNLGLGGAYKRGARATQCDYILIVAGDSAMPVGDITLILEQLGKADVILPYLANPALRPFGRRFGSATYTRVINFLFGLKVPYYNGMVPRREMLSQITISADSYAFQAEAVVKLLKGGCSSCDLALYDTPRGEGHSVALEPKRLVAVLRGVINLYLEIKRPGGVSPLVGARSPAATHPATP